MTTSLAANRTAPGAHLVLAGASLSFILPALVFLGAMLKTGEFELELLPVLGGVIVGLLLTSVGYLKRIAHAQRLPG